MEQALRKPDYRVYVAKLRSDVCHCGNAKRRGMSFCPYCWQKLPAWLQRSLYRPLFHGYEEAYEESLNRLNPMMAVGDAV